MVSEVAEAKSPITHHASGQPVKEVTILALGQSRTQCPFEGEVWGLNEQWALPVRVDKLFILDKEVFTPMYIEGLKKQRIKVVTREKIDSLDVEIYPLKEISERFGSHYFACTIAYMVAYAMYYGYNSIKMYGADMWAIDEFRKERPCLEYWLGRAIQSGVKIENTDGSVLLKTYDNNLYGWEMPYEDIIKGHKREWPELEPGTKWRIWNCYPRKVDGANWYKTENNTSTGVIADLFDILYACPGNLPTKTPSGETVCSENVMNANELCNEIVNVKQKGTKSLELDDRLYKWLLKFFAYKDHGIAFFGPDVTVLTPLIRGAEKQVWIKPTEVKP